MKQNKGITLIALIITIIVMLILVGVTINFALNGGIINKAKEASIQTEIAIIQEQLMLKKAEIIADNMGSVPASGYGLSSISDLDGLSQEIITKYNSKLTISSDGTLYYLEDNVTGEEKVYFENAGIRASSESQQPQERANVEYYTLTDGSTEFVAELDYINSTLKLFGGPVNGNLSAQSGPPSVTYSTGNITVYLDNAETTINNAIAIVYEESIVGYVKDNKLYLSEENNNRFEYSSTYYATLDPNFDTSRLVDTPEEPEYKIYSGEITQGQNFTFALGPNNELYVEDNGTWKVAEDANGGCIDWLTIHEIEAFHNYEYTPNGVMNIDVDQEYMYLCFSPGIPIAFYYDQTDNWYVIDYDTYDVHIETTPIFTPYSGDTSAIIEQLEALNS